MTMQYTTTAAQRWPQTSLSQGNYQVLTISCLFVLISSGISTNNNPKLIIKCDNKDGQVTKGDLSCMLLEYLLISLWKDSDTFKTMETATLKETPGHQVRYTYNTGKWFEVVYVLFTNLNANMSVVHMIKFKRPLCRIHASYQNVYLKIWESRETLREYVLT